ncbi:type II toxin-antitoxin system CcdA family antitoxin [Caldivirga sp.]|uniref:type II toxin-antitoxin system CcdA family antitoxin n=1 Tax=Caldivirga sp. TaxID=2080243 RepID=UPI0025B7D711|nr:type II toxin-antitoxin system CcdA family antitoxin [Caldivirga sp.]
MGSTVILSVRVRRELKERAEQLGINIRDIVEKVLENAIREKEREEMRSIASELRELLCGIDDEEWTRLIRGNRDAR